MGGTIIAQDQDDLNSKTVTMILKTKLFTSTRAAKAYKERVLKNKEQMEELAKNEAYLLRNNVSFEKARKDQIKSLQERKKQQKMDNKQKLGEAMKVLGKIKKNKVGFYQSKFDEIIEEQEEDEESSDKSSRRVDMS